MAKGPVDASRRPLRSQKVNLGQLRVALPINVGIVGAVAARIGLEGRGLDLGYNTRPVVHAADIRLQAGRVAALVGPNGSGKSTLLRGLARLHHLDAGLLRLGDGRDAYALLPRAFAREVTMLAQNRPTPSGLAVRDVVGFGRHPYRARLGGGGPGGAAAVDRSMRLTGVADIADRAVDELSGGQLQRVWLGCCLAQATGVLLLDEPTTCPRRGSGRSRVPRSPGPGWPRCSSSAWPRGGAAGTRTGSSSSASGCRRQRRRSPRS